MNLADVVSMFYLIALPLKNVGETNKHNDNIF